jgi:hypothetical protein
MQSHVGQRLSQVSFADNVENHDSVVNHDSVEVANMKHVDRENTKGGVLEESNHSFDLTQSVI